MSSTHFLSGVDGVRYAKRLWMFLAHNHIHPLRFTPFNILFTAPNCDMVGYKRTSSMVIGDRAALSLSAVLKDATLEWQSVLNISGLRIMQYVGELCFSIEFQSITVLKFGSIENADNAAYFLSFTFSSFFFSEALGRAYH